VSAYDDEINIVLNGADSDVSGTSAACPMVAGMLASINDALAAAGHKTLGFANPFLYANEAAFLDITKGNNRGIAAVKGYDGGIRRALLCNIECNVLSHMYTEK
jgi:tripeptidyl-peptidase-1